MANQGQVKQSPRQCRGIGARHHGAGNSGTIGEENVAAPMILPETKPKGPRGRSQRSDPTLWNRRIHRLTVRARLLGVTARPEDQARGCTVL
eukprot:762982-Hanusia_phi.AAC.4